MGVDECYEDLIDAIKEGMSVLAGGVGGVELGELTELLGVQFQALAHCNLLLQMDVEGFERNLQQSGFCRRFFLRKSLERIEQRNLYWATSRSEAIFSSIASGSYGLARDIVGLSPHDFDRDGEYEDDFWYHKIVHELVRSAWDPKPVAAGLSLLRFESVLAVPNDPRLRLCAGALGGDAALFWDGFDDCLRLQQVKCARPPTSDDPWEEPLRHIWVEGLAWLRIARELNFAFQQDEYPLCPEPARHTTGRATTDLFRAIEREVGL